MSIIDVQKVEITLKEYLEYTELKNNQMMIKIKERKDYFKDGKYFSTAIICDEYKSQGHAIRWCFEKIQKLCHQLTDKIIELKKVKKMSIFQFMKWRKEK